MFHFALLEHATADSTSFLDTFGEFTALAFLGIAFLMTTRWLIGRLTDDIKANTTNLRLMHVSQLESMKLILAHDARVLPGINLKPTTADILKAREDYERTRDAIDNLIAELHKPPPVPKRGGITINTS